MEPGFIDDYKMAQKVPRIVTKSCQKVKRFSFCFVKNNCENVAKGRVKHSNDLVFVLAKAIVAPNAHN